MASMCHPSFDLLSSWLTKRGVFVHPALIPVLGESGWTVVAREEIPKGEILCTVPKAALLSHRTGGEGFLSLPDEPTAADHTLHLASCLLYELRKWERSDLYPWMQILPRETVPLPTFWANYGADGREGLKLLTGTEAGRALRGKEGLSLDDITAYFHRVRDLFPLDPAPSPPTFAEFLHAFSLVSTRGYVIDAYHIIALVPFVDLFNHSANNHTSLASDAAVCPTCGSLIACAHDAPGSDRTAHLNPAYLVKAEADHCVEMRAERDIVPGEVFSCYEEDVGEGTLLVEWGFIAGEGTGPAASWSPREVVDDAMGRAYLAMVASDATRRSLVLPGSDRWIHPSDHPGHFDIRYTGTVSINLLIVLYLHSLDAFPDTLDELEEGFVGLVRERLDGTKLSSVPSFDAWKARLGELVRARLEGLGMGSGGSGSGPLTSMARRLALSEKKVLEGVLAAWGVR